MSKEFEVNGFHETVISASILKQKILDSVLDIVLKDGTVSESEPLQLEAANKRLERFSLGN